MPAARRTDAVLLLVAIVWGSSYLAAKTATAALPVLMVLFARYAISAVACLAIATARGRPRWTRDEARAGTLLGVTQAAVLLLETYGVAHTSAANAGLIISLTMVLTPLLDRGGGRGLPPRFFAAAGVCVVAVGLLMAAGSGLHAPRGGDLLILAAAVVRAAHVVVVGRLSERRALRPLHLTTVQTVVGSALFLLPVAGDLPTLARASATTWAELLHLALFCSVFAFLAQTWAVQRTSAGRAGLLLGTEPVWALAVGIAVGGERLTVLAALGAALMVAGTSWGQAVEREHRETARPRDGHLPDARKAPVARDRPDGPGRASRPVAVRQASGGDGAAPEM
ncbi:DMT family transporter [Streptomyces sp. GC420]|uniref:DMT family transporter n=1 Tax=Streptomyces sp. GC420 TaxID=2697568 RepID=UPI001414F2A6|nr:DMT family transporter [Streptomyces sp. GC420]NBM18129.1 EamA family transporter [Streptomyces sp. GC420]